MLELAIIAVLAIFVLRRPYLGIVIVLASLPITDIMTKKGLESWVITVLGGLTLLGFLLDQLRQKHMNHPSLPVTASLAIGFVFCLWLILSNPSAAITRGIDGRIWAMTFVQLWLFAWMTAVLFDTKDKIVTMMWVFVFAAFVSAVYACIQGFNGRDIHFSLRVAGLAGGANSAARYFVIALTFIFYLFNHHKNQLGRLVLIMVMAVLILGILLTVSRTGLLLLVASIGLAITQNLQSGKRVFSIIVLIVALLFVWLYAEDLILLTTGILPAIMSGADTVGVRYGLWQAGIRMWVDHPLAGVGVGNFQLNLPRYGGDLLPIAYLFLGAHNMYIAVLSETGIIGLVLFLTMFILALRDLIKAAQSSDKSMSDLAGNWLLVTILILLAGITKHDHYEKLPWIVVGMGSAFKLMNDRLVEGALSPKNNLKLKLTKSSKTSLGHTD